MFGDITIIFLYMINKPKNTNNTTLLSSVMKIRCISCNIEHDEQDDCPKCGDSGGAIVFKTDDCTLCKHFNTSPISYPSGKCMKHNIMTGIREYCKEFNSIT